MPKGKKYGGGSSGPRRKTAKDREILSALLGRQWVKLEDELDGLHGREYVSAIVTLLEFHLPKLARAEVETESKGGLTVTVKYDKPK